MCGDHIRSISATDPSFRNPGYKIAGIIPTKLSAKSHFENVLILAPENTLQALSATEKVGNNIVLEALESPVS